MFLLKCTPLKKESLWLQRSKWKISCRCGVGKERGQISSCKDVACEAAVTVKLPGVHGDCHGWRTQKGLHNSSVTFIFWEQRSSCRDTIPAFMWFHLPWDSTKAQKQKPVIFLLCFQRLFMTVCSMPGLQPSAWFTWTAPTLHCPAGNSNYGALLCFIFPSLSPMLPQGGWKVMRHLQCLSALC